MAVAARLDKTDDMRLETVPGVAISTEKLESNINAVVSHQVVVVVS